MCADIPRPYHRPAEPGGLARLWYASPFYRALLRAGGKASAPVLIPPDPWPGSSARGAAIVEGAIAFGQMPAPGAPDLAVDPHGFAWLRDLRATGSESGRRRGRELMRDWITHFGRYDPETWRGDILAERVVNWLAQHDYFLAAADPGLREKVAESLLLQCRHLARVIRPATKGAARIRAAKALVYAGASLPDAGTWLDKGLELLEAECAARIHSDGGVHERCPSVQLYVLRDLVDTAAVLAHAGHEPSVAVQQAIDRTGPMLRFFRLGDGGLALFNDGFEEEPLLIDMVLDRSGSKGKALASAPHTGFQRLVAGRTTLLFDGGAPPPAGLDARAHAGEFAFEMSVGKERLIVNCGAAMGQGEPWRDLMRATAAHTALVLDDTNAAEILPGAVGRRPSGATCRRREAEGAIWLEAESDGYAGSLGYYHHRRLYLAGDGLDLRGEDVLVPAADNARPRPFAIRFHLHPDTRLERMQKWESGAQFVDFGREGTGRWRLHCDASVTADVEDSTYLGRAGETRAAKQIVLTGKTAAKGNTSVRWAIRRAT